MPSNNLLFWACSFQRVQNRFFTKFAITKPLVAFGVMLLYTLPTLDDVQVAGRSVDQKIIKRDFMRVVMSAEYGGNSKFGRSVKNMIPPSALQSSIIQNKLCMTALSVLTYLSHKARL